MKIYVWRGKQRFGPFAAAQEVQAAVNSGVFSLADTSFEFWFDEDLVLPAGLQWDWDGRQWRVTKKRQRTAEQQEEVYRRNGEYERYTAELWKLSAEEAVEFATRLPPDREKDYSKNNNQEREARRLRGLRPFVSHPRYIYECVRIWVLVAALIITIVGAHRGCVKSGTLQDPTEHNEPLHARPPESLP